MGCGGEAKPVWAAPGCEIDVPGLSHKSFTLGKGTAKYICPCVQRAFFSQLILLPFLDAEYRLLIAACSLAAVFTEDSIVQMANIP